MLELLSSNPLCPPDRWLLLLLSLSPPPDLKMKKKSQWSKTQKNTDCHNWQHLRWNGPGMDLSIPGGRFPGVELRPESIGDSHLAWGCNIWKVFRWDVQKTILRDTNNKQKSQNMVCLPLKLLTKPVGAFFTYLEPPISHILVAEFVFDYYI